MRLAVSVDSRDRGEAQELLSRALGPTELACSGDPRAFHLWVQIFEIGDTRFGINRFGAATDWQVGCAGDDIALYLPLRGRFALAWGGREQTLEPGELIAGSCCDVDAMRFADDALALVVTTPRERLNARLASEGGRRPLSADDLYTRVPASAAGALHLSRLTLAAATLMASPTRPERQAPWLADVDEAVMGLLLPAVMAHGLLPGQRGAARSHVDRACAFLAAHADRPVTVLELAAAVGVTPRALQAGFRKRLGLTPMGYLRRVRLDRAREELVAGQGAIDVAAAATRWGFGHLGRFSAYYRAAFGEKPSDTVRRSRP